MKIQLKLTLFLKPIIAWIETLYTSNIKKSVDVKNDDDDDDGENDDDYENDDDIW